MTSESIKAKKIQTAIELLDKGMTRKDVARKMNITEKTLRGWIKPTINERETLKQARTQLIQRIANDTKQGKPAQSIKDLAYTLQTISAQIR